MECIYGVYIRANACAYVYLECIWRMKPVFTENKTHPDTTRANSESAGFVGEFVGKKAQHVTD